MKSATDSGKSLNQPKEIGLPDLAGLPDLNLNQHKEMGLPDLAGLPDLNLNQHKEMGLPDLAGLPDLPDLPDHVGDLEERFKNLLTDTPCGNDETLVSGGIPNLGIEMNRNDIPELDLANIPGAVPPCGVGAKKKEAKKIRKKIKKQLKKEVDRHDAVAKQKKEKAEALRQSIDYCERKPEALQFAIDVNRKQPIEKKQCYTEDTEEKEKKKEKKHQYLLVCGSNDGCNYGGYRKRQ